MTTPRVVFAIFVLVGAGGLTAGCGGGSDAEIQVGGDPPIFTFHGEGGMDALLSGTLRYLRDEKCIVLDQGSQRTLAVFPAGSEAHLRTDGSLQVDMNGYGEVREGVALSSGGGVLSADAHDDYPPIPKGCSTDGISYAILQDVVEMDHPATGG